jgi:co-chaperonin GroES (HSP10)
MMDAVGASIQDAQSRKSMPVKTGDRVIQSKNNRSEVYE